MNKEFNIIITGVGGQGIITVLRILAEAAFLEGFEVKTSEVHGLSQREGSVSTHIRFGPSISSGQAEIYSPLVKKGGADLILALEMSEGLRAADFSHEKTIFVINKKFIPYFDGPKEKEVLKKLEKITGKIYLIEASKICQEKFKKEILAGMYLLGYAFGKQLIPLKLNSILGAIKKVIPKEIFSLNKKVFEAGYEEN